MTMTSLKRKLGAAALAVSMTASVAGGLAVASAPAAEAAGFQAMTNNWSNWWDANAQIWISNCFTSQQSVARLGNNWKYGARSCVRSEAMVHGYSWTHEAYQIRYR